MLLYVFCLEQMRGLGNENASKGLQLQCEPQDYDVSSIISLMLRAVRECALTEDEQNCQNESENWLNALYL